jgi:soluble lytic murein transglycosylase-like protein
MTTQTYQKSRATKGGKSKTKPSPSRAEQHLMRFLPGWIIIVAVLVVLLPNVLAATYGAAGQVLNTIPTTLNVPGVSSVSMIGGIAPLFTQEVRYWANDIQRWAAENSLDPNLLATIMQIESCGHADVSSHAGAQGLFQVMPFHFSAGENQVDPNTNARRGANFLNQCLGWAEGDPNRAMACYNGGPGVLNRPYSTWPSETQRYYQWGSAIYADAVQNLNSSTSLDSWLSAGGSSLCTRAANNLGLN